jgi:hypothetical protein
MLILLLRIHRGNVYICINTCIHIYTYTCIFTYVYVCIYMLFIYVSMYVYILIYMYMHTNVNICKFDYHHHYQRVTKKGGPTGQKSVLKIVGDSDKSVLGMYVYINMYM